VSDLVCADTPTVDPRMITLSKSGLGARSSLNSDILRAKSGLNHQAAEDHSSRHDLDSWFLTQEPIQVFFPWPSMIRGTVNDDLSDVLARGKAQFSASGLVVDQNLEGRP